MHVNCKGPGQPCSLISAFVIRSIKGIKAKLDTCKNLLVLLVSVAEHVRFSVTW